MICQLCGDRGFTLQDEKVITCYCKVKESLKRFLPDIFIKYGISKEVFHIENFNGNLIHKTNIETFGIFINTFLSYKYFKGLRDYEIVPIYRFLENYYIDDSSKYFDTEILVLLFMTGYRYKTAPAFLSALLNDRELNGRDTIVFIDDLNFNDSKIADVYGREVLELFKKYKKVE